MPADPSDVRRDWAQRGVSCDVWVDPPGQAWRDFVHPVDELVTLIEGEIELSLQPRNGSWMGCSVRPICCLARHNDEAVFIPAGVAHTVRNVGTEANRWY